MIECTGSTRTTVQYGTYYDKRSPAPGKTINAPTVQYNTWLSAISRRICNIIHNAQYSARMAVCPFIHPTLLSTVRTISYNTTAGCYSTVVAGKKRSSLSRTTNSSTEKLIPDSERHTSATTPFWHIKRHNSPSRFFFLLLLPFYRFVSYRIRVYCNCYRYSAVNWQ